MATSVTDFLDVKVDGVSYKETDRLPNRSGELYPSASDRIFLTQAYYDRLRLLSYLLGSGNAVYAFVNGSDRSPYKHCSAEDLGKVVHDNSGHGYSRAVPGPPFGGPPTVVTPLFTDADTTLFMSIAGLYHSSGIPSFVKDDFSIRTDLEGSEAEYDPSIHGWSGDPARGWAQATTDASVLRSVFTGNRLSELSDAPHGSDPEGGGDVDSAHCPTFGASSDTSALAPCLDSFVFRRSRVTEAYENLSKLNRAVVRLAMYVSSAQIICYPIGCTVEGSAALVTDGNPVDVSVYPVAGGIDPTVTEGLLSKPVAVLILVVTYTTASINYEYKYTPEGRFIKAAFTARKSSVVAYRPDMSSFGKLSVDVDDLGLSIPESREDFPLTAAWVSKTNEDKRADSPYFVWKWSDPEITAASVNASACAAYAIVEFNSDCHTNVDAQGHLR